MSETPATDEWMKRNSRNPLDRPRVSVWWPTQLPEARLQVHVRSDHSEHITDSRPIAYLTIAGVEIGGPLDDLELLLSAAQEELLRVRRYAVHLMTRCDAWTGTLVTDNPGWCTHTAGHAGPHSFEAVSVPGGSPEDER